MGQKPANSVQAAKRANRIDVLKRRAEAGEDIRGKRGYIRMGQVNTAILTGQEDLSVWTEEELIRGQKRGKNGKWQGRKPKVVPTEVHDELVRRTLNEAKEMMRTALMPAVTLLGTIITDPDASDKDKLQAASMVIDRMMGKTPERITVSEGVPEWFAALTDGIVSLDDEQDDDEPIDVESWEDDDDD